MAASAIVAQVRATSMDLLQGLGMKPDDAREAMIEARGRLGD
jgi:hypothetical protein